MLMVLLSVLLLKGSDQVASPIMFIRLDYIIAENNDPHTRTDYSAWLIHEGVNAKAVNFKPGTMSLKPDLATAWKLSRDKLTYTYHLRKGVKLHDGMDFNSEAVKINSQRLISLQHGISYMFNMVKAIELEPFTVKFVLQYPYAPLQLMSPGSQSSARLPTSPIRPMARRGPTNGCSTGLELGPISLRRPLKESRSSLLKIKL
jgi:ABC-type transport system substrate-binding protein